MKKGFTLVELLGVLAVLSVVIVIAGTSYSSINKKNKKNQCENLKQQIENSAIEYVSEQNYFHNIRILPKNCTGYSYNCGDYYNKKSTFSANSKGDIVYQEKIYKYKNGSGYIVVQDYTPTVLVNFENVLNYGYYNLNENNELENPYDGSVIDDLKIEVRLNNSNNFTATSNLDCGD